MDKIFDFAKSGMKANTTANGFTVYTSLSWTGKILLGNPGKAFHPDLIKLCPSLDLGSVALLIDIMEGSLISAHADQGECDFPYPGESTRLMIVTAEPMLYTAPQLRAIAKAFELGRAPEGLSEVAASQAADFVDRLRLMRIGTRPAGVVACLS